MIKRDILTFKRVRISLFYRNCDSVVAVFFVSHCSILIFFVVSCDFFSAFWGYFIFFLKNFRDCFFTLFSKNVFCPKNAQKMYFCKLLKINDGLKKFNFSWKKDWKCFGSSEKGYTFALAFGKQRGCSSDKQDDPWQHSIQTSSTMCLWFFRKPKVKK